MPQREPSATQVVTFPVEVDISNAAYAGTWLLEALDSHPQVVIADMSLTEFCDTSGIRTLLLASKRMAEEGIELRVVLPSASVRRTMHFAGADMVLRLFPDMTAALTGEPATPEEKQTVHAFVPRQGRMP